MSVLQNSQINASMLFWSSDRETDELIQILSFIEREKSPLGKFCFLNGHLD